MSRIVRVEKNKNFTVMGNWHLRDKGLSLKAKGFLSLILSLPEGWFYSKQGMGGLIKEGQTVLDTVLKELKEAGYLEVNKLVSDKNGRFEYEYVFYEKAVREGAQEAGILNEENPDLENPDLENPDLENHPLYKYTNIQNTEELNKNDKKCPFEKEFEELWKLYPNKKGKVNALKAYVKARKSGESVDTIKKGILAYKQELQLKQTPQQYQAYGSTWFNQERWKDEYQSSKDSRPQTANAEDVWEDNSHPTGL